MACAGGSRCQCDHRCNELSSTSEPHQKSTMLTYGHDHRWCSRGESERISTDKWRLLLTGNRVQTSELVANLFQECDPSKGDYHGLCKYAPFHSCTEFSLHIRDKFHGLVGECVLTYTYGAVQIVIDCMDFWYDGKPVPYASRISSSSRDRFPLVSFFPPSE